MTASSPSAARATIDQLEGLLAKATPGPWHTDTTTFVGGDNRPQVTHNVVARVWDVATAHGGDMPPDYGREQQEEANAVLIAAAVTALPHLLAAIKAVDELAAEWETSAAEDERWLNGPRVSVSEAQQLPATIQLERDHAHDIRAALALAAVDVTETADGAS